jgi:hypothetical protein
MLHMCLSTHVFCMFDKNIDNKKRGTTGKEERKRRHVIIVIVHNSNLVKP